MYAIELFSFRDYKERVSYPEAKGLRHLAFAVVNLDKAVSELKSHLVEIEPIRTDEITGKNFAFFMIPTGSPLSYMKFRTEQKNKGKRKIIRP